MSRPTDSLQAVLPSSAAQEVQPLHAAAASRALELQARTGLPVHTLMARAGRAVARLALAAWPGEHAVHALAGPGNNGGDALVAAGCLQRQGLKVRITLLGDPDALPDDARWALQQCREQGLPIESALPARLNAGIVLDGLLGLGVSRPPAGAIAEAVRLMAGRPSRVLAIDLPSGLDGDRGTLLGDLAVTAAHTLSLLTLKPGLFTAQGRDHAGRVWLDRLGVAPPTTPLSLNGGLPVRQAPHAAHKGSFGDLLVIGGAPGMAGAAWLAARAALAAGAGRVFLGTLDPGLAAVDPARPELMHRAIADLLNAERLHTSTVVCGCGGGEAVAATLPVLLNHAARLLLDADGLNALAADPQLRRRLQARGRHGRPTVLTPHPLEAARLLGCPTAQVQSDRVAAAGSLSQELGCTVVLKGSGTLIARPDGRVAINPTGNPRLASAGTGDVLAGWIGGLWARDGGDGVDAALAAAFRHGLAAEHAPGDGPLRAGDLIEWMRAGAPSALA